MKRKLKLHALRIAAIVITTIIINHFYYGMTVIDALMVNVFGVISYTFVIILKSRITNKTGDDEILMLPKSLILISIIMIFIIIGISWNIMEKTEKDYLLGIVSFWSIVSGIVISLIKILLDISLLKMNKSIERMLEKSGQ